MDMVEVLGWIAGSLMVLAVMLFASLIVLPAHVALSPEVGEHVGVITETGYGGLVWKTHFAKTVSNTFSVDEDAAWSYGFEENDEGLALFNKAKEYQKNKSIVSVSYECKFWVWYWEGSNACIINDIVVN